MKRLTKYLCKVFFITSLFLLLSCGPKTFTDLNKVSSYLSSQKKLGSTVDSPVPLVVAINLQNTVDEDSNWHKLLKSINTSGLYVALDLSKCTMPGTEFNPDGSEETGKKFIVSLILPDIVETLIGANSYPMYQEFINLNYISGKNVKIIQVAAFRGIKLANVDFPSATELGLNSFYGCTELTEVSFPNVVTIGNGAFRGCTNLVAVDFPKAGTIGKEAFKNCKSLINAYFPKTEIIGDNSFEEAGLENVNFPLVTKIGNSSFANVPLLNATFPEVTTIDVFAFAGAFLLTNIEIPKVETIGELAFVGSGIESIIIPLATKINGGAFDECNNLKTVTLGTLSANNFPRATAYYNYPTFPGNLRQVYFGEGGGPGTYVKDDKGNWTKQDEGTAL